jgi:hypothetical protein
LANLFSVKKKKKKEVHQFKIPLFPDFLLTEKETQDGGNFPNNAFTQSCG